MIYLIAAANAMYPLLFKEPPRLDDLVKAASIGCKTLTTLLDDSDFKEHVSSLYRRSSTGLGDRDLADYRDLPVYSRTLAHFSEFLEQEKKLMLNKGLERQLVEDICQEAEKLRHSVRDGHSDISTLFDKLEQVRNITCTLSDSLKQNIKNNRVDAASISKARSGLIRVLYAMTGLTLITLSSVNPDSLFTTLTITVAAGFISQAVPSPDIPPNIPRNAARRFFRWRIVIPFIILILIIASSSVTIYIKNLIYHPALTTNSAISFGNVIAYFYVNNNGTFDRNPSNSFIFTQSFPVIAFNPNPSAQDCSESTGVNTNTRPFTDILQNPDGSCKKIPAQDNSGNKAGIGNLYSFEAVYLTSITVPGKGILMMQISADDGWIISIGANSNGGKPPIPAQTNTMTHPPAGKRGPINKYPEMGDNNVTSSTSGFKSTANFSAAGTYPVEIDYTECCGSPLTLVITNTFTATLS